MTPVGVLPLASVLNSRTSDVSQGSPERRLYLGLALRGPVRPIGEPGRFQDGVFRICLPFRDVLELQTMEGASPFRLSLRHEPASVFARKFSWLTGPIKSEIVRHLGTRASLTAGVAYLNDGWHPVRKTQGMF